MPGAGRSIEPFGNIAPAVKHGMVNGVVVRGMGSGLPEPWVCERALVEIKDQKRRAKRWHIPRLQLPSVLLRKGSSVGIGHSVDEIDLAGPQRGQTHLILFLGVTKEPI